jgi:hypothetical protein
MMNLDAIVVAALRPTKLRLHSISAAAPYENRMLLVEAIPAGYEG